MLCMFADICDYIDTLVSCMLTQIADDGLLQIHSADDNSYRSKICGKESTHK